MMKSGQKNWFWILILGICFSLTLPNQVLAAKEVKIALFGLLSGSGADAGHQGLTGAQLAVEDINNSGGIKALGGAKLKMIVTDVTSTYSRGPSITARVLSTHKVAGAVGYLYSGMTLACLPVIEKAKIPLITTSVSDKITSQGYKYVFEICPKGSQFGITQVEFAAYLRDKYKLKADKLGFVFENGPYGTSTAKGLKEGAEKVGFHNIVLYQPYDKDITDAGPLVTKIKSSGANIVFATSYTPDAQLLVSTMKSMRVNPVLIGGGAGFCWPAIEKAIGPSVNGVFSVGSWSWDVKNTMDVPARYDVTQRYKKKYGVFMAEQAGEHYAAVWLLKDAIEKARSADPQKVRDALAKYEYQKGLVGMFQPGQIKFDDTGWNFHTFPTMIQWQNQVPRTVYPQSVASTKVEWPVK